MLGQRGLALTPGQLKDEVFIPGREGSLQLEMVAAARRGMLVYPLQGGLEGVLEEVAAGNPVLVLQNQAFSWWPRWHFAVVVGFDRERRELVLRSGITRRWVTDFTSFESTWKRSGRWAVLTLPGDRLPATAAAVPWLKAASDSENRPPQVARRAYEAVRRWPGDAFAWFALGNSRYAAGDSAAAEQAMLTSVERRVDFAAGWFNLSQLLAERGCAAPARQAQGLRAGIAAWGSPLRCGLPQAVAPAARCAELPACPLAHRPAEAAEPKVVGTPFQRDGSIPGRTPQVQNMANDKRTSPPPRLPAKGGAAGKRQGHAAEGTRKPRAREERKEKPADGRSATALTANERREIDDKQPPRAAVLHEVIRVQGEHELQRTVAALWWSAVAAGLTIGLSLMGMGLFRAAARAGWAIIVSSFGYPMGFLAVILARQQLFTENT